MGNIVYKCSPYNFEGCKKLSIKKDESKDPRMLLEDGDKTECWKCGSEMQFVEKR